MRSGDDFPLLAHFDADLARLLVQESYKLGGFEVDGRSLRAVEFVIRPQTYELRSNLDPLTRLQRVGDDLVLEGTEREALELMTAFMKGWKEGERWTVDDARFGEVFHEELLILPHKLDASQREDCDGYRQSSSSSSSSRQSKGQVCGRCDRVGDSCQGGS